MADGFKKYFNGTTMNGRANVAKATYATLALFYIIYRVRRSKGTPKNGEEQEVKVKVEDQCSCDSEKPEHPVGYCDPHSKVDVTVPEKECALNRDKSKRRDDPPPPPPQSPQNGASTNRKCPCHDPHLHIETPKQTIHQSYLRQSCNEDPQVDQVHPAREIIGHMQEAASRVLRNVIGAVLGSSQFSDSSSSSSCSSYENEETCNAHASAAAATAAAATATAGAAAAAVETLESADHGADNKLLSRKIRTSPRLCVPPNANGDSDLISSLEESHHLSQSQSQSESQSESQAQSQSQSHYRPFNDEFASEMFFEDFDE